MEQCTTSTARVSIIHVEKTNEGYLLADSEALALPQQPRPTWHVAKTN
jgi:hypothetical protein